MSGSEFLTVFSEVKSIDFSLYFSLLPLNITGFFDRLTSSLPAFLPCGLPRFLHGDAGVPMRASEDFGVFGWGAKAAMLCLGPGEDYAALHNPDYDFCDDLIPVGSAIFERIARDLLGTAPSE